MAHSKIWRAMTPEERAVLRKGYRENHQRKHPGIEKLYQEKYKDKPDGNFNKLAAIRQKAKHRKNKLMAIEYKGGICFDCKCTYHQSCYDFHHVDPTIKDSAIAKIMGRDFERIKPELDKCVMLCANCHRVRHFSDEYVAKPHHRTRGAALAK